MGWSIALVNLEPPTGCFNLQEGESSWLRGTELNCYSKGDGLTDEGPWRRWRCPPCRTGIAVLVWPQGTELNCNGDCCRALATLEVPPLQDGEAFQIGWIQVCTDMEFVNVYGTDGL